MRAEILLELSKKIKAEIALVKPAAHLAELQKALQGQIENPSKEAQTEVSKAKAAIINALGAAPSERYPPYWRKVIDNAEISQFLGLGLARRVNHAISQVGVTPIESLKEIEKIIEQQKIFNNRTTALRDALIYYEIDDDPLPPGEFEVMVSIPGGAIDDELRRFGKEAIEINNILLAFEEIATGSREPIKLRAVASSDPTLYVYAPWAAAALIATSIERLSKFYGHIQTLVQTHRDLKKAEAPKDLLEQLQGFIDAKLKASIDEISKDVMLHKNSTIDEGRGNELLIEINHALIEIARRLDLGYGFDVRGSAPEAPAEGEVETLLGQQQRAAAKIVEDARPALQAFEPAGEPILMLPIMGD